jgi:hypothetical protein
VHHVLCNNNGTTKGDITHLLHIVTGGAPPPPPPRKYTGCTGVAWHAAAPGGRPHQEMCMEQEQRALNT